MTYRVTRDLVSKYPHQLVVMTTEGMGKWVRLRSKKRQDSIAEVLRDLLERGRASAEAEEAARAEMENLAPSAV